MNWVLWREYRRNRLILIVGALLLLLPYLFLLKALWDIGAHTGGYPAGDAFSFSLILSQLTVALLGCNAIAGERADRSAEFIAYLPLSRRRLLAGKLILASSAVIVTWAVNLLVFFTLLRPPLEELAREWPNILGFLSCVAVTGLAFYGVAWLISSLQSSPTFAIAGALATPLLIGMGLAGVEEAAGVLPSLYFAVSMYAALCAACGILGFAIGTWYYLRRVEP